MRPSLSPTRVETEVHHLLGQPTDLAGHIEANGPLSVFCGHETSWERALMGSLRASGLTGRGGGGFPSSIKLALASSHGRGGIVVINGMEGEPASDKDKLLLTRMPHLVLDGAQFLAAICRSSRIVACVPVGRDGVAAAVEHAIAERSAARYSRVAEGLARPPDRFVAGEESSLANWLESGRSLPVFRPDKGTSLRIGKQRVLVHNAETLAHIALIARRGPQPFLARGTDEEPGTCLVTISGAVAQPGVVEIDRGTPLWHIAQRSSPVQEVQALLVGGYGGTWVGPEDFATPYLSSSLRAVGAAAGVGVVVVLGESGCGVAESARIARYLAGQSSGQCGPCVFGLAAITEDLDRLATGRVDRDIIERLQRRLSEVSGRGACGHPDGAVSVVRSALSVFREDVAAHARSRPCDHRTTTTVLRFPTQIA